METEAFAHARLILIWGSNTLTSNLHLWPFVQAARKQGARVMVIDPACTRTAQAADEWIAIRPGTDGALALAMMHVIIGEGLYDADYVARYTVGFDALAARVREWTPERAAAITGIAAERIRNWHASTLSRGRRRSASTMACSGTTAAAWPCAPSPACRLWWAPGARYGGGIQLSTSGNFRHLDRSGLYRPDLGEGRGARGEGREMCRARST